jgi:hypothetical protein
LALETFLDLSAGLPDLFVQNGKNVPKTAEICNKIFHPKDFLNKPKKPKIKLAILGPIL